MRNDACDIAKEIDIPEKEETSARAEGDGPIKGFSCQHHGGCGPKDRSSQTAVTDRTNAERKGKRKKEQRKCGAPECRLGYGVGWALSLYMQHQQVQRPSLIHLQIGPRENSMRALR